jgi:hypothetical protein
MPLTGSSSVLSAALRAAMLADPDIGAVDDVGLTAMCDAIASTVLAHIIANAVIPPGIAVATTGSAVAQTGATTAPGTIT